MAGDAVLVNLFRIIRECTGSAGEAYRKGGEEIVVLLPGEDSSKAIIIAERIRSTAENSPTSYKDKGIPATISIGVATHPPRVGDLRDVADRALYRAKKGGRNRVELADQRDDSPASH